MDEQKVNAARDELLNQIDSWIATDEQKNSTKEQIKNMPLEEFANWMNKHNI
jgi:hypothetical protein